MVSNVCSIANAMSEYVHVSMRIGRINNRIKPHPPTTATVPTWLRFPDTSNLGPPGTYASSTADEDPIGLITDHTVTLALASARRAPTDLHLVWDGALDIPTGEIGIMNPDGLIVRVG